MHNIKDTQFVGKHDYDKSSAILLGWNKTFSIGVFKWEIKQSGKEMKKSKAIVRIYGNVEDKEKVFKFAENVVIDLDNGEWDGRKTVFVK